MHRFAIWDGVRVGLADIVSIGIFTCTWDSTPQHRIAHKKQCKLLCVAHRRVAVARAVVCRRQWDRHVCPQIQNMAALPFHLAPVPRTLDMCACVYVCV